MLHRHDPFDKPNQRACLEAEYMPWIGIVALRDQPRFKRARLGRSSRVLLQTWRIFPVVY